MYFRAKNLKDYLNTHFYLHDTLEMFPNIWWRYFS